MHWTLVRAIVNLKRHAFFNQNQFSFSKPSAHITHYATKTLSDITAPHKTSYCFLVVVLLKTCKHTLMCKNVELPFNFLHVHVVLNSLDGYNFPDMADLKAFYRVFSWNGLAGLRTPQDPWGGAGNCFWSEGRFEHLLPTQPDPGRMEGWAAGIFKDKSKEIKDTVITKGTICVNVLICGCCIVNCIQAVVLSVITEAFLLYKHIPPKHFFFSPGVPHHKEEYNKKKMVFWFLHNQRLHFHLTCSSSNEIYSEWKKSVISQTNEGH